MKKRLLAVLMAAACVVSMTACSSSDSKNTTAETAAQETEASVSAGTENPAPSGEAKDTLTVAISAEPKSLDPFGANDSASSDIKHQMYDTVLYLEEDASISPNLAESFEWKDDVTLELKIRDDVTFHNGDPLLASDVFYTVKTAAESEYTMWITEGVNLDASSYDNETGMVTLVLDEPSASLTARLCQLNVASEAYATSKEGIMEEAPMGTGPFVYDSWTRGDSIVMKANKDYWKGAAAFDTLRLRVITESATRTIEIEAGGVDIIMNVLQSDVTSLEDNPNVNVIRTTGAGNTWIGFNCTSEPFNEPKVRQAIAYAIDKEAIVEAVYNGVGSAATGPIPPSVWGYTDETESYPYDVEKAKALLAEAGYPDGFEVELKTSDSQVRIDICEIVKAYLEEIGIDVKITILENATYLTDVVDQNIQMFILGWETTTLDADYGLYEPYHSGMPTWANTTGYSNPDVDKLLDDARVCLDQDKRLELYKELQILISQEAPCVYLWDEEDVIAALPSVKGLTATGSGRYNFVNVHFE